MALTKRVRKALIGKKPKSLPGNASKKEVQQYKSAKGQSPLQLRRQTAIKRLKNATYRNHTIVNGVRYHRTLSGEIWEIRPKYSHDLLISHVRNPISRKVKKGYA